jgi:hypothetical protein
MRLLSRRRAGRARERARLRRRLRDISAQREALLRDLGGLALEMHKRDRFEPRLLSQKGDEIAALDAEAKLLRRALEQGLTSRELEALEGDQSGLGTAAGSHPQ